MPQPPDQQSRKNFMTGIVLASIAAVFFIVFLLRNHILG
jgi:hypothetical protein